jgi:chromosome segregation and condensation protein ScpB
VSQLSEWTSQYRGELEKQSSSRAAQVESLLTAGDYEAIREWLGEWEAEDKAPNSLYQRYRSARLELQQERYRQRQQRLYGSMLDKITGKASTKSLSRSGADLLPDQTKTRS